jgi:hypothetical protein
LKILSKTLKEIKAAMKTLPQGDSRFRAARLLESLVGVALAKTFLDLRRAKRKLLDVLVDYALEAEGAPTSVSRRVKNWFGRREEGASEMSLHALQKGLRLVVAREAGQAKAWEGIQIVREFIQERAEGADALRTHAAPDARSRAA